MVTGRLIAALRGCVCYGSQLIVPGGEGAGGPGPAPCRHLASIKTCSTFKRPIMFHK